MEVGQVVISKAGRDKNLFMVLVSFDENSCFVADGKERPLERPKLKNYKHLIFTENCLTEKDIKSNRSLRAALKKYKQQINNEF